MTAENFLKTIETYYGLAYTPGQRPILQKWLEKKSELYLSALSKVLIENYSGKFKTLPDIAVFNELKVETMAEFRLLEMRKARDQVQIPELTMPVQEAHKLIEETLAKLTGKKTGK